MMEKQRYRYVTLRYSHDIVSGEFVNVGVVLASEEGELLARTRKTIGRIKPVFPDLDRKAFVHSMKAIDRAVKRASKRRETSDLFGDSLNISSFVATVLPNDDSSLGWSSEGGGVSGDIHATFERLFERFVGKYDSTSKKRIQDDDVWRPVRDQLDQRGLRPRFETKLVTGQSDSIEFSKAWKNGYWHVYEALSMDLADAEGIKDKARRWRGHLEAVADAANDDVKVKFVVGKPTNTMLIPAYDSAMNILRDAPFIDEVFDEEGVSDLVDEIEDELRAHQIEQTKKDETKQA